MVAVMVAGSRRGVPALATTLRKNPFTEVEVENAGAAWLLVSFILRGCHSARRSTRCG